MTFPTLSLLALLPPLILGFLPPLPSRPHPHPHVVPPLSQLHTIRCTAREAEAELEDRGTTSFRSSSLGRGSTRARLNCLARSPARSFRLDLPKTTYYSIGKY